ncbi:pyrimidine 5'-nucleotidase [Undibacterium terreum]|uniref:Pyrimidine 5'-nucleotidase n=1 Tax=Undibacterium terreum TaxID=1224302 RepID=A0A916UV06_9BURK|nr:pyrimidine 5'-nucleotidase [Undibacterium terreum]GGC88104.1 pyrimidine 5'-nucleotidase [Undibacterium terreum]
MKHTRSKLVWLFDLDNTLHNASHAIFPAVNVKMNAFMARVLGDGVNPADPVTVDAARLLYWRRYGATLMGLIKHHGVNADEFLHEAHTFDDLSAMIRAERGLGGLLRRLPGRKILLTNAPRKYARDVVGHLGLHRHFAEHIPIEDMRVHGRLSPKPSRQYLRKLVARLGVRAGNCVLVEDTVANLRAAKQIGMRTVLVTQYLPRRASTIKSKKSAACIDVTVKSVQQLPGRRWPAR